MEKIYKMSPETREKMRLAKLGKVGFWKGKKRSDETRKKMSIAKTGFVPYVAIEAARIVNSGIKRSPEWCERNKEMQKGEKSYLWKGGISKEAGYYSMMRKNRRAREKNAVGQHSVKEWEALKESFNSMCLCCKKIEPEIKLTEDHIIPLIMGGTNYIENIQPLCVSCNSRKNVKTINYIESYYQVNQSKN